MNKFHYESKGFKTLAKLLLVLLLFVITITTSNAKDNITDSTKLTVQEVYNDFKSSTNKVYEDTKEVLKGLSGPVGKTAEHVYITLTKKHFLNGVIHLSSWLVCLVCLIVYVSKINKDFLVDNIVVWEDVSDTNSRGYETKERKIKYKYPNTLYTFQVIFTVVAAIILIMFIFLCVNLDVIIVKILNPEYYTLQQIVELISQLK